MWAPYFPETFEDKRRGNKKKEADVVVSGIKFIITEGTNFATLKGHRQCLHVLLVKKGKDNSQRRERGNVR